MNMHGMTAPKLIRIIRLVLFALIIIGIGLLFSQAYWVPKLVERIITYQGVYAGEACGGNKKDAMKCAAGYRCEPAPGARLPFGDVGGICMDDQ
ncbi:MAG: hypothetical protein WC763_01800 [Candidatus Paceibacterota bacterium]|jgi:hypothetical protein